MFPVCESWVWEQTGSSCSQWGVASAVLEKGSEGGRESTEMGHVTHCGLSDGFLAE